MNLYNSPCPLLYQEGDNKEGDNKEEPSTTLLPQSGAGLCFRTCSLLLQDYWHSPALAAVVRGARIELDPAVVGVSR